jgi:hypothetical protein
VNWTRRDFELTSISCCRAFRIYLRRKEVWIFKETTSAKSLYDAFKKKTLTSWTEDEIKRSLSEIRFTFYLIKEFLKASSDEILQRQKHEVSIDHEEFMTERYIFTLESSSPVSILSRSFASSPPPLSVNQSIKHPQPENQVSSSLATSQGPLIIDNSEHVSITENSKHSVGPSDGPLVGQPPLKPPSPENQGRPVERSDEPSISSPRPIASLISFTQPGRQPTGQSMGQSVRRLMSQLVRRSMNQSISDIHVRCGIEWIKRPLLNETEQWLLNNRANHLFKVASVSDQKVLPTSLSRLVGNLTE